MNHPLMRAAAAGAAALALGACDPKSPKVEAAAQKIEAAVERTGQKLAEAGERTQQTLSEGAQDLKPRVAEAGDRLQPKLERAGERIANAGEKVVASVKGSVAADPSPADGRTTTTVKTGERTSIEASGVPVRTREALGDTAITASVKAGLVKDPDLSVLKIDVDTKDGVVTLNGLANTDDARRRATEMAQAVKGVREVRNHLTVRQG